MKKYGTMVLMILILMVTALSAQADLELRFNYQLMPKSNLQDGDQIEQNLGLTDPEFQFYNYTGSLNHTQVLKTVDTGEQKIPVQILISNVTFHSRKIEQDFSITPDVRHETFMGISYRMVYVMSLSKTWGAIGFFQTALNVDELADAQGEDLSFQGGLLFDRRSDSGWTLGLGVMYAQFTGQNQILPFPYIAWRNETMELEFLGPRLQYWYRPGATQKYALGMIAKIDGHEYIFTRDRMDLLDSDGQLVEADAKIALSYSSIVVGPTVKWSPIPNAELALEGGWTLIRRYEYRAFEEDETVRFSDGTEMDFDLENTFTVEGSVSMRF